MLTSKDTFKELEVMDKVREGLTDPYQKASLKMFDLIIKLLLSIRSNQTATMTAQGVALKETEQKGETK